MKVWTIHNALEPLCLIFLVILVRAVVYAQTCQFYPLTENRRFERVSENIPVDQEIFRLQVFPRQRFEIEAVDNSLSDIQYFKYEEIDQHSVAIKVAKSLDDLVDRSEPHSVLKFKLTCKGDSGTEEVFLPVTVYIEDINDHAPQFENTPYHLAVDELTPVGLTIFRGIHAVDRDKPNTANSDVTYSIVGGNEENAFVLSDPIEGILVVNKPLDYDHGIREFKLHIQATDHGSPQSLSTVTTMTIKIKDADDQNPVFTHELYTAHVTETPVITGATRRQKIKVDPPIHAYDLDAGINARMRYKIILGNDEELFYIHEQTGELFLVKEIDLENLISPVINLQIQAVQRDNPAHQALAKVRVFVLDVNDNIPVFEYDTYNITVVENLPPGFTVVQVLAHDKDLGDNAKFRYILLDDSQAFAIDETSGWITVRDPSKLDRETKDLLIIKVIAEELVPNVNLDAPTSVTEVHIHLLDANDNNPLFIPSSAFSFTVTETDPPGSIIGSVRAVDPDIGNNGIVHYSKQDDGLSKSAPFDVHASNGSVYVLKAFSEIKQKPSQYTFFLLATDSAEIGYERRSSVAVVHVNVTDINNNSPEFEGAPYETSVGESLPPGAFVAQVRAQDQDSDTILTYSIIAGNEEGTFSIDSKSGRVTTATVLDYEERQTYDLLIQVSDGQNMAVSPLSVKVVDINDKQPVFTHNYYNFSVFEELQENVSVGTVLAVDGDTGKNAEVRYSIIGNKASSFFHVDQQGNILTRRSLDRETDIKVEFLVIAFDRGIPQLSGTATVFVRVDDINDNAPYFERESYTVLVPEEREPPYKVFEMNAADKDKGDNAIIKYSIVQGNDHQTFEIDEDRGILYTADKLNYEDQQQYTIQITARNLKAFQGPQASTIVNPVVELIVKVQDINDGAVVFTMASYHYGILETTSRGKTVGFVNATNFSRAPRDQDIIYWVGKGNEMGKFWLNPATGALVLMDTIDRDPPANQQYFKLEVFARDTLSINSFNTSVEVKIEVIDVNDNVPVFDEENYSLELPENLSPGTQLPPFYRVLDIDAGNNGNIEKYYTNGSKDTFVVNRTTGSVILVSSLDYEVRDQYKFTVFAVDGGNPQRTGSATVVIKVQNINEYTPEFVGLPYDFWAEENAIAGTGIGQVKAFDKDRNNIFYSLSKGDTDFFGIEEDTGRIYVKSDLVSRTQYSLIVQATDDGEPQNNSLGVTVNIFVREVNDHAPIFSQKTYKGFVTEKEATNKVIIQVAATDRDLQNNTVTYSITSGNEEGVFYIDAINGNIRVNRSSAHTLDYDKKKNYVLLVQAKDSHASPLFGLATVVIDIRDTNDHPPVFSKPAYSVSFQENLPAGYCFLTVKADSRDSVDEMKFALDNKNIPFVIDSRSGEVCTKEVLDREQKTSYEFSLFVFDGKFEARAPVTVEVLDENDNAPKFEKTHYVLNIPQESKVGRSIIQIHASDPDADNNGEVTYWIKNTHGLFEIDPQSGLVRLASTLPNYVEKNTSFEMEVYAQDHGIGSNIGKASLIIRISNIQNHQPEFDQFAYMVAVDENVDNIVLLTVHATDTDKGKAGNVVYRILRATRRQVFRIDRQTGAILLVSPLDYEDIKYLELVVEARDKANEPQFSTAIVQITVNDVNDNAPVFLSLPRFLRVPLSTSPSEVIYKVEAVDKDSSVAGNNKINYEISPPSPLFTIESNTGQIIPKQSLSPIIETLNIVAYDSSTVPLSSSTQIVVEVYKDSITELTPVFTSIQYSTEVDNVLEPGETIMRVRAAVPNGDLVWYNITKSNGGKVKEFSIDYETGIIVTTSKLDVQESALYHFLVTATNQNDPRRVAEAGMIVRMSDRNSKCPSFPFSEYYATVKENTPPDSIVLPNIQVEDAEKHRKVSYSITEDNSLENFYVDSRNPLSVFIRVKRPLDRDTMPPILQGIYTLMVTASNQRCASSVKVKILVEDENDNEPVFEKQGYIVEVKENTRRDHVVTQLKASDSDEIDSGKLRYFIIEGDPNNEFQIDEKTGVVSIQVPLDRENTPAYMLRILAVDSANNTGLTNLHVVVLDENDWSPVFFNDTFVLNVTEGPASVGVGIQLYVVDNDEGKNGEMVVYIDEGNSNGIFRLGVKEGKAVLSVRKELDRENYDVQDFATHLVKVAAKDMGIPSRTGTAQVVVLIQDINDNPPQFEKEVYYQFLSESVPVGTVFETVKATDADTANNTNLKYSFAQKHKHIPFEIDPASGTINITRQLDVSEAQEYTLTLEVFDGQWKGIAVLKVIVSEAEERDPRFNQHHYNFAVLENTAGALVGQVKLKPRKHRLNTETVYIIVNSDVKKLFSITEDGHIFTKVGLDRETRSKHTFTVMLEERRPSSKVSISEVSVEVLDVNDQIPTFLQSYQGSIKENVPSGTPVNIHPLVSAVDNDSGNNSVIHYSLSGQGSELFHIENNGVVLFLPKDSQVVLDREKNELYKLQVIATDLGNLSSSTFLTIRVEDENDNAPRFQHGPLFVKLPETAKPGSKVVEVTAVDADATGINSKIEYVITAGGSNDIRIDRITGEIYVVGYLSPETFYFLNITAVDGKGLGSSTFVNITVTDVNDHRPTFVKPDYMFKIQEGDFREQRWKVGVLHAVDQDTGKNGLVDYNLMMAFNEDFPFVVDVHTGELFVKGVIDRETQPSFIFAVMALDYGEPPLNSTVNVTIEVQDINDEQPKFLTDPYLAEVPENQDPGLKVTKISAIDADLGENGLVFYQLGEGHKNRFYIDSKDGTVWTLSKLDYEQQRFYNMTVIAYDHGTPTQSATVKLWVTVTDTNDVVPEFQKSVYTLEVAESTKAGEVVFKLDAGSGNFQYKLLNDQDVDTFSIDEETGEVFVSKPLDSIHRSHYRLLVSAKDNSDPPKVDKTELNIIVGAGTGVRLFPSRLYEVTVQENKVAPLPVLDLNTTDEIAQKPVQYSIVEQDINGLFTIEAQTGLLVLTATLDREQRSKFFLKIRAEDFALKRYGRSVGLRQLESYYLAYDETLVLVTVGDENDNVPVFENGAQPVIAAVPLEATYGFEITRVKAIDADIAYNAAIRYEIIQKDKDASSKFHIDPVTGIIRSMVTFSLDRERAFGFDVKATDREGSSNGHSALTNVFIYVLPETKLVVIVTDTHPLVMEQHMGQVLSYLSNMTGYEVQVAKLESHHEGDVEHPESSDLFLYGINRETNDILDTEILLKILGKQSDTITNDLSHLRIRRIQEVSVHAKISQMGTTEIAIIALSSVIFLGGVLGIALLCSSCKKRKMKKGHATWEQQRLYNIKNTLMNKSPYGGRISDGSAAPLSPSYTDGTSNTKSPDSVGDRSSIEKNYKDSRQQVPPDGASSHTRSRSPRYDGFNKRNNQWDLRKDENDSFGTRFSHGSAFNSWSSRYSHTSRSKQATDF